METSIVVLGLMILLIGLFVPPMYLGLMLLIGIVIVIIGLRMESQEQREKIEVMRRRKLCRICGKTVTKAQAETLGICQECLDAKTEEESPSKNKPCRAHGLQYCPYCYPKKQEDAEFEESS